MEVKEKASPTTPSDELSMDLAALCMLVTSQDYEQQYDKFVKGIRDAWC